MSWIDRFTPWRRRKAAAAAAAAEPKYLWRPAAAVEAAPVEGPVVPRFQSTAGDQFDARNADRFAMVRAKLRNAYTPAQPVTDRRMFAGRTKVLTAVIRAIEDQRLHAVIYGERGIGKTSLLHVLAQAAQEARYLVVYVTCGTRSEFDETFRAIATSIPLMFHTNYGPTSIEGERGDTLSSLLSAEPMTVRSASDALSKIEGTRVLVILDEFDRATSEDFRRSIAELLKNLSDQAVRAQFVIAGVAANLAELVANVPSIQRNVFALQVPKMTAAEIRSIVKNGESISDLHFEDGAVHAVIARCIGFPYLATLISHRAALVALDQNRIDISAEDVIVATREAVEELRGRISRRSQIQIDHQLKKGQLAVLGALAGAAQTTGGWFRLEDITAAHADPAVVEEARAAVARLAAEEVLIESREDDLDLAYRFIETSVPVYLWLLASRGQHRAESSAESRSVPA